jgi:hypothetical protein
VERDRGNTGDDSSGAFVLYILSDPITCPHIRTARVAACTKSQDVDITYKGSGADANGRGNLTNGTVSGGENRVGVEKSATADVRTTFLHADNKGEVVLGSSDSTNDLQAALGDIQSHGDCGQSNCGQS